MLKMLGFATLACLSMVGTAYANDSNYRVDAVVGEGPGPGPVQPGASLSAHQQLDKDLTADFLQKHPDIKIEQPAKEAIQIGGLDLTLTPHATTTGAPDADVTITAEETIPLCGSPTCQKKFQFVLTCQSAEGHQVVARSPWYRNYVTGGMEESGKLEKKTYTFQAPELAACMAAPTVDMDVELGWSGTEEQP